MQYGGKHVTVSIILRIHSWWRLDVDVSLTHWSLIDLDAILKMQFQFYFTDWYRLMIIHKDDRHGNVLLCGVNCEYSRVNLQCYDGTNMMHPMISLWWQNAVWAWINTSQWLLADDVDRRLTSHTFWHLYIIQMYISSVDIRQNVNKQNVFNI